MAEAGAPDDVRHVEHPAVLEQRQAVAHADDPRHALDARARRDPSTSPGSAASPPCASFGRTLRPIGVRSVSTWWPRKRMIAQERAARDGVSDAERGSAPCPARTATSGVRGELMAISAPELPAPTTSTPPVAQLRRVAVLARVQLHDPRVELARRTPGPSGVRCAPDATTTWSASNATVAGRRRRTARRPAREPIDADAGAHRQVEALGVGLEVVAHLVLRRERTSPAPGTACRAARRTGRA